MNYAYVVVWTLWNLRNKLVFEDMKPDWELEKRQIKVRWSYWLKSWMANEQEMIESLSSDRSSLRKWHSTFYDLHGFPLVKDN